MEPGLRRFDIRDYLRILTKRKWFIIMVAVAATIIGGTIAQSYPRTYRAATTVLIRRQAKPAVWIGDRASPATQPLDLALETQTRLATSSDCAERAAQALANRSDGTAIQVTPSEILASVEARAYEPDQIRIIATSREEQKALAFANEVAAAFEQESLELRRNEARAAREFLENARLKAQKALDEAQAAAAKYQEKAGILLPSTESQLYITQLYNYRDEERKVRAQLAAAEARLDTVRRQLGSAKPFSKVRHDKPNPTREALLKQLEQEQLTLTQLRARYKDTWPAVREVQRRVEELQAELLRQPETVPTTEVVPDMTIPELRQAAATAERDVGELSRQLRVIQENVRKLEAATGILPAKLEALQRLLDRAEMAKTAYQNILAQLETARLNEAMKLGDAQVIDRAVKADQTNPPLGRMLAFAFVLGLFFGVALAMVLEALDDTLHTPEDITAYTDVQFLGIVPLLEESGQGLVTVTAPKSPPAEAYRTLRSNIHFAQLDNPARTFLVTSAGAGEGKTLTVANLACVLAQAGQQVLLIDADLRRPSLHRLLRISSERGLTNVLVGEATLEEVAQDTEVPGLRVVATGPLPPNPAELIESQRMNAVIQQAKQMADVVLFDSPPAIILTDAVILSSKVERTILVAEAGQVSRDAFNEMCRIVRNARGHILGAVLNKLRLGASDYYYYYYYYDYSHYAPTESNGQGSASANGDNGLVPPETPTVLDSLFGEDDVSEQRDIPTTEQGPESGLVDAPRPDAGAREEPPSATAQPSEQPSAKRWRFNGQSYRRGPIEPPSPGGDTTDRTGRDTSAGAAGPEGPPTPRQRNILDELFGEEDEGKTG